MFFYACRSQMQTTSCCIFVFLVSGSQAVAEQARLNQIQVIGTHNSYHVAPERTTMDLLGSIRKDLAESLDYTHRPLSEQFSQLGIRQIELDVFADPQGGLFATPWGHRVAHPGGKSYDPTGLMSQPGLKVLHIQDVDYRTRVLTFVEALKQIRTWSNSNPKHVPILVLIEAKQDAAHETLTKPHPFGEQELDGIDKEILSVFERAEIVTPDDIRGDFPTLRQAMSDRGWPRLGDVRGKVIFALDNEGQERELYLTGHPSLRGRLLFVSVGDAHPAAAFMKINDPIKHFDRIREMVEVGFIVRTRADAGTKEARNNDVVRREKALASGAQFVSTDYPEPDRRFSEYCVQFDPRLIARANPVSGQELAADEVLDPTGLVSTQKANQ